MSRRHSEESAALQRNLPRCHHVDDSILQNLCLLQSRLLGDRTSHTKVSISQPLTSPPAHAGAATPRAAAGSSKGRSAPACTAATTGRNPLEGILAGLSDYLRPLASRRCFCNSSTSSCHTMELGMCIAGKHCGSLANI